jgi:hypothetical protein
VEPAVYLTDGGGDLVERIEGSGVHVSRLGADDQEALAGGQHVAQGGATA